MLILLSAAVLVMVPAAIAWACNPQAHLNLNRTSYTPGQTITVSGQYFNSSDQIAVSVPGDSATTPVSGGGFTVQLTAPSTPGSYTVVAKKADGSYRQGLPKSASFQVAAQAPSSQPQAQSPPQQQQQPAAGPAPRTGPNPTFGEPGVQRSPDRNFAPRTRGGGERGQAGRPRGGQPGSGGTDSPAGGGSQRVGGVGGGGDFATTPSGQEVFAGSVAAPESNATPAAEGASGAAGGRESQGSGASSPSELSATGDVWSGFSPGETPSLSSDMPAMDDGGSGFGFGGGIALLILGLLALMGGLTAAEVRRRKVASGR